MTASAYKVRVPFLERLALYDLADRRGETEEQALARIIREAVRDECARPCDRAQDRAVTLPGELPKA